MAFYKGTAKTKKEDDFKYEVVEECGTLGQRNGGYELKLRLIKWNGNDPKYDLRCWKETDEGEKMLKGQTMSGEELEALYGILKGMAEEKPAKQPRVAGAKRSRK